MITLLVARCESYFSAPAQAVFRPPLVWLAHELVRHDHIFQGFKELVEDYEAGCLKEPRVAAFLNLIGLFDRARMKGGPAWDGVVSCGRELSDVLNGGEA